MKKSCEKLLKNVYLKRGYSEHVSKEYSDKFFDWVYIDANHSYKYVKQDLLLGSQTSKVIFSPTASLDFDGIGTGAVRATGGLAVSTSDKIYFDGGIGNYNMEMSSQAALDVNIGGSSALRFRHSTSSSFEQSSQLITNIPIAFSNVTLEPDDTSVNQGMIYVKDDTLRYKDENQKITNFGKFDMQIDWLHYYASLSMVKYIYL